MKTNGVSANKKTRKKANRTYLLRTPVALSDVFAVLDPSKNLFYRGLLLSGLLGLQTLSTLAGLLLLVLQGLLDKLNVLEPQLLADNIEVTGRVHVTLDVDDLSIVETPNDLEDGIDGTNVRQEGIAKTGTGRGTAGQASDVIDGEVGGNSRLGVVFLAQPVVARIGDDDTGFFRVDSGIGEVLFVKG